mgnify:CR=1 FL=1|jgi:hypothetical protein
MMLTGQSFLVMVRLLIFRILDFWTLDFETSYKTYYYWIIGSVFQN